MKHQFLVLSALLFSTIGLNEVAANSQMPPPGAIAYGVDKTLSLSRLIEFDNLAFPQSYKAMRKRFGSANYYTQSADYYRFEGVCWVVVNYAKTTATFVNKVNCPSQRIVSQPPINTLNY